MREVYRPSSPWIRRLGLLRVSMNDVICRLRFVDALCEGVWFLGEHQTVGVVYRSCLVFSICSCRRGLFFSRALGEGRFALRLYLHGWVGGYCSYFRRSLVADLWAVRVRALGSCVVWTPR